MALDKQIYLIYNKIDKIIRDKKGNYNKNSIKAILLKCIDDKTKYVPIKVIEKVTNGKLLKH